MFGYADVAGASRSCSAFPLAFLLRIPVRIQMFCWIGWCRFIVPPRHISQTNGSWGLLCKKIQGNGCCFARKQPASFHLLQLAWSCLLGLVRLACSISHVASVSSIACTHIICLIKAWCLYDNGTPALLHNAFPIGERRPNEVLILNHIFHECLPELLTNV